LGEGLSLKGNYRSALKQFDEALIAATNDDRTLAIYKNLRDTYTKLGNYKKALSYNDSYLLLKDSLDSRRVKQEIVEITERYESAKKEVEIGILNSENKYNTFVIKEQKSRLFLITLLLFLIVSILGLIIYFYQKQRLQRQILYEKNVQLAKQLEALEGPAETVAPGKTKGELTGLDISKLSDIKESIVALVSAEFYLERDMTLQKMAKAIETVLQVDL